MKHHHQEHEPHDTSDPHDETNFLESACTSVTEEESEESSSSANNNSTTSWFGAWASTLRETAGGVVKVVKTCAINVAAEIALLEDEECLLDGSLPQQQSSSSGEEPWHLPWEIRSPETGEFYEDMDLQQRIVQLSRDERNFLEPYSSTKWNNNSNKDNSEDSFVLDDARVHVIRQLLTRDQQLAAAHARWSGRPDDVHEVTFWRNYFHACEQTRKAHVHEEEDDYCVMKNRHGLEEEESVLESSNLEELSQKSLASQRSVNSLVPDDDSSEAEKVNDAPDSPESLADDSSYVCVSTGRTSPLGSVKSFKSSRSAGSLVMVEAPFSAQNSFLDYGSGKAK